MDNYKNEISRLETKIDFLEAELLFVNQLLIQVGFDRGLEDLKSASLELLSTPSQ